VVTAVVAWLALLVAAAALALAVLVMRQNGQTTAAFRTHRLAHARAEGAADPDRRARDDGPPTGQPERRQPPPDPATDVLPAQRPGAHHERPRPPVPRPTATRQDGTR
jgi:hypothetical protein